MTVIFKAKTQEGYVLKILAELFQNNLKTACFILDNSGIKLCMMDHNKTILIDLELDADNFSIFTYKYDTKMYIGINLSHFYKMLKCIKKKDSIQLFINDDSPNDLGIKIIPKENNRVTTSYIKIQNIQTLYIDLPTGYNKPINIPSNEFQKMCKGLTQISNTTKITSKGFMIKFESDADGIMKRSTEFGEPEESESDDEDNGNPEYSEDFDTEHLTKITKLAGLYTTMQVYPKLGLPLMLRSCVGTLGRITIYIKSKKLIEEDSHTVESEDE